jgi:hypothetical protein
MGYLIYHRFLLAHASYDSATLVFIGPVAVYLHRMMTM